MDKIKNNFILLLIILILLIISVIIRIYTIDLPLVDDRHSFRQAQTAITIQDYFNHGFSIINYKTPVFGPPWQVPFEFPVYQITVYVFLKILNKTNIDLGCRIISIIYFYLSAFALLFLCRYIFKNIKIYITIFILYLFTPFNLFWSRAALPDYASVFFTLLYILFFIKWLDSPNKKFDLTYIFVIILGILGCLCKITTLFPAAVILSIIIINTLYNKYISNNILKLNNIKTLLKNETLFIIKIFLLCIIPVIIGIIWTNYTDFVKNNSIYTKILTSEALKYWNYGHIYMKLDYNFWLTVIKRISLYFSPSILILLFPLSIYSIVKTSENKYSIVIHSSIFISIIITILSLINLYYVHDYYLIAISPYICIILGFGLYYLFFEFFKNTIYIKIIMITIIILSFLQPEEYIKPLFTKNKNQSTLVKLGKYIKNTTRNDECIYIQDNEWSSGMLYSFNRRGFMYWRERNLNIDAIKNNNFTTYIKYFNTEINDYLNENFYLFYDILIDGWEIYKLYDHNRNMNKTALELLPDYIGSYNDMNTPDIINNEIIINTSSNDPYFYYILNNEISLNSGIPYIEITYKSSQSGYLQLFYDYGDGINEDNSVWCYINERIHSESIYLPLKGFTENNKLFNIRIDPPEYTELIITNINIVFLDQ